MVTKTSYSEARSTCDVKETGFPHTRDSFVAAAVCMIYQGLTPPVAQCKA